MREIKFRAKLIKDTANQKKGKWFYWNIMDDFSDHSIIDQKTIEQFSGQLDKNNKEIYQENIVENQHGTRGVYVWNNRREGWDVWYKQFPGFETMNEWTVIGDVHDNPELLN